MHDKTDKDKKTRMCNVPDCGPHKKLLGRGLCSKHYYYLKSPDPAKRAEANKYAAPPKRKGGKAAEPPAVPAGDPQAAETPPEADIRIAAITEFASALGIRHSEFGKGRLFTRPEWGERVLVLTEGGYLRWAGVNMEKALETC
jgi:hypothetical protein